jgi:hypothetical protein
MVRVRWSAYHWHMATQTRTESSTTGQILDRLAAVEIDIAVIKPNQATREDVAQTESRLIKWLVATSISLAALSGSLAFLAARFIH